MFMALAMNRVGFVKLLLEIGVSMGAILNQERMEFLYAYVSWNM